MIVQPIVLVLDQRQLDYVHMHAVKQLIFQEFSVKLILIFGLDYLVNHKTQTRIHIQLIKLINTTFY